MTLTSCRDITGITIGDGTLNCFILSLFHYALVSFPGFHPVRVSLAV